MSDVRWEGLTHEEIYARVQRGPGRAASADAEAAWATVESTIRAVDAQLSRAVGAIGVEWQGPAADGVRGGLNVMSNWALDAAGDALLTRDGIAAQAAAAGHVRDAMPPPRQELDTAVALASAGSYARAGTDFGALEDRMAEERAMAVDLMTRYTSDSSTNQQMMNYWTQPPSVVVEAVPPGATTGHGGGTGRTAGPAAGGPAPSAPPAGPAVGPSTIDRAGGTDTGAGRSLGRPGSAVPGRPASGTAGAAGAPADRLPVPIPPPTAAGPPASRAGRPPGVDLPAGGVRQVVPGVPARPATDPPSTVDGLRRPPTSSDPPTHPTGRPASGGRGVAVEPVPRTGLGGLVDPPGQEARGPSGTVPRAGGPVADAVPPRVGARADDGFAATGRGSPPAGHGVLPLGGVARPVDQEHRRAAYLVDDTDAFADDRWFTPPVIGGDDLGVARA